MGRGLGEVYFLVGRGGDFRVVVVVFVKLRLGLEVLWRFIVSSFLV